MRRTVKNVCAAIAMTAAGLGLLGSTTAQAAEPDMIALGAGAYDVLHNNKVAEFRGEYRFGWNMLPFAEKYVAMSPQLGVMGTTDRTFYGYGGIRFEIPLGSTNFYLTPSANAGYWHRGSGKNLGSHVEFKTGAEFSYKFANRQRLGIAFDHMSNAGISKTNPGVESLMIFYSFPLGK